MILYVGQSAPKFSITDAQGKQQKLVDYDGKWLLIVFDTNSELNVTDYAFLIFDYTNPTHKEIVDKYQSENGGAFLVNPEGKIARIYSINDLKALQDLVPEDIKKATASPTCLC